MKYLELLNQTAEETAKQNNSIIAEEAALNLQYRMLTLKKASRNKEFQIAAMEQSKNIDFSQLSTFMDELALLDREVKTLEAIKERLF